MRIIVEGGVIQDILDIPGGVEVVVHDYDVEDLDLGELMQDGAQRLETDGDGHRYLRCVWNWRDEPAQPAADLGESADESATTEP
jgi:hypothetical protein